MISAHFKVGHLCHSWLPDWREDDFRTSISADPDRGGGVLYEVSHELDLLLQLIPQTLTIHSAQFSRSTFNLSVDEAAQFQLSSTICPDISIDLSFASRTTRRFVRLEYEDATIYCDLLNQKISN